MTTKFFDLGECQISRDLAPCLILSLLAHRGVLSFGARPRLRGGRVHGPLVSDLGNERRRRQFLLLLEKQMGKSRFRRRHQTK